MLAGYQMTLPPQTLDTAAGQTREVLDKALKQVGFIPNMYAKALAAFTRVMVASRGLPDRKQTDASLSAGYGERQILEIVLALAVKTLSNYANHLFHTRLDDRFATRRWADPR